MMVEDSRQSVAAFYDDFLDRRMIQYRVNGNLRLDLATKLLLSVVKPADMVADIGCGIGMIAERVGRRVPRGKVVGVDVSKANIDYAKSTIDLPNVEFFQTDVTRQFERLRSSAPQGYDVIALIDVIEHIPETQRTQMFSDLERIATPGTFLVLTYPSPDYQRSLIVERSDELQIIDNIVEIEDLCQEAAQSGWRLKSFEMKDVWLKRQYAHCVFDRDSGGSLEPVVRSPLRVVATHAKRILLRPYRSWYYKRRSRSR